MATGSTRVGFSLISLLILFLYSTPVFAQGSTSGATGGSIESTSGIPELSGGALSTAIMIVLGGSLSFYRLA
jgi:hypothetical protein